MAFGHLADDGQAETGAGHPPRRRRPVETVEDTGQVGGRDPGSEVAHGELAQVQAHPHLAARRAELGRVIQEVPDRDRQAFGAPGDGTWLEIRREGGPRPVPARSRKGRGDNLVQAYLLELAGQRLAPGHGPAGGSGGVVPPGQLRDVGHQLAELGDLRHDPVVHLLAFGLGQVWLGG